MWEVGKPEFRATSIGMSEHQPDRKPNPKLTSEKEWLNAKGTEVKVQRNQEMVLTFIPKPTMIDSGKKASTNKKGNEKNA